MKLVFPRLNKMLRVSADHPEAPKYQIHQTSGPLRSAVEHLLRREPLTDGEVSLLRVYLCLWIGSPAWKHVEALRRAARAIRTETDIRKWLFLALERGFDPL